MFTTIFLVIATAIFLYIAADAISNNSCTDGENYFVNLAINFAISAYLFFKPVFLLLLCLLAFAAFCFAVISIADFVKFLAKTI